MSAPDARLLAVFSSAGWARFIAALRAARDRGQPLPVSVRLRDATPEERASYARLLRLSRTPDGPDLRCHLRRIEAALALQGVCIDWQALLLAICGPPPEALHLSRQQRQAWGEFLVWSAAFADAQPFARAADWLKSLLTDGSLQRLSKGDAAVARRRLEKACRVLAALPLSDEPLPFAAARLCGDAHALDPASPLHGLIIRSLAMQQNRPLPERSDDRRDLLEQFGIICDDLSAPVLTLNLGLGGDCFLCRLVSTSAAAAQPLHITNRMISAADWSRITCPEQVFICENPTIIALAASRLGTSAPPMLCTNGEPRSTSRMMLRRLRAGGAVLWYHGDFDWPGISIAARVFSELSARPWLFDARDYTAALERCSGRPLEGTPAPTPWCPELAQLMITNGRAVDEEAIFGLLLESLRELSCSGATAL